GSPGGRAGVNRAGSSPWSGDETPHPPDAALSRSDTIRVRKKELTPLLRRRLGRKGRRRPADELPCACAFSTHGPHGDYPPQDAVGVPGDVVRLISRRFPAREMRTRVPSAGPESGSDPACFSFHGKCATPPASFLKRGRADLATVDKGWDGDTCP